MIPFPSLSSADDAAKFDQPIVQKHKKEIQKLRETNAQLRAKIQAVRQRRRQLQELRPVERMIPDRLNRAEYQYREAVLARQSALAEHKSRSEWLDISQKWNVTNDCFHIWHRGSFACINGLRLGVQAPTETEEPRRYSVFSTCENIVGWNEINSALGLVALLLSSLEQKPHSGITFQHKVLPMGSTSKIGLRRGETVTLYNLYSDDSFQFFGKRNFNMALNGLLHCVYDAAQAIQKRDRTITLPHLIEKTRGDLTIAGLSVSYGTDGEEWTRVMKYLLTDIKWCVAYASKHVDQ